MFFLANSLIETVREYSGGAREKCSYHIILTASYSVKVFLITNLLQAPEVRPSTTEEDLQGRESAYRPQSTLYLPHKKKKNRFGRLFTEPDYTLFQNSRICDLQDQSKAMDFTWKKMDCFHGFIDFYKLLTLLQLSCLSLVTTFFSPRVTKT